MVACAPVNFMAPTETCDISNPSVDGGTPILTFTYLPSGFCGKLSVIAGSNPRRVTVASPLRRRTARFINAKALSKSFSETERTVALFAFTTCFMVRFANDFARAASAGVGAFATVTAACFSTP